MGIQTPKYVIFECQIRSCVYAMRSTLAIKQSIALNAIFISFFIYFLDTKPTKPFPVTLFFLTCVFDALVSLMQLTGPLKCIGLSF